MRLFSWAGLGAALLLVACSEPTAKPEPSAKAADTAAKASDGHAPAGFTPGSYEDWCGEHQVPESQCTRCNSKLIPAFKAANDWCAEHDMPESQCTKCDPGRKAVRPPKPGG